MKEKIKSVIEYKNQAEDKRKKEFQIKMAKVIALSERNLKII